ncbi:hypothetical protein PYW08_006576 [Mythimna loreyi]|uniref:Uncharacterized protein n=1 Tax=Mythimna loreyi TaxID=667449 RepID=A0ACC2QQ59_9NEOP|nr:hypothetical protein PYW08_006576 [Mythimna loreyi]
MNEENQKNVAWYTKQFMMAGRQQLRLLLWKDYLVRKRKLITLLGVIWASSIMFSFYVVRLNIYNIDFPSCGFPARPLPSAGMMKFLQAFMCSVANDCTPLDHFDEIPTYEDSKLTQLQRSLAPVFEESVLDVIGAVPDAIKLVATLADVVDQPAFINISKNGLKVKHLFAKPEKVKRYVSEKLELSDDITQSIMDADLSFQGLLKGNMNRCSVTSVNETIVMENDEHLKIFVEKLCSKSMDDLQKILMDVLFEVDFNKYLTMIGDMYFKMSGDNRLNTVGNMMKAVLRMVKIQNFLPTEVVSVFQGQESDYSYIQLSFIPKVVDHFKTTFGDTQSYELVKDFTDAIVVGLQFMDKVFAKQRQDQVGGLAGIKGINSLQAASNLFHNAASVFEEAVEKDESLDAFNILSQIMNFIHKFLPKKTKHDVLFYSTLLAKLMESAYKVIDINMNIEQLTYNVTLRNPGAVEILKGLPPNIIGKAFEALTDAERTQILTSKINFPGQMFCDAYKLQTFFVISKADAESVKKQLCTDAWKNYVTDLIESFGVFEVKRNINNMASLLLQETLGKDTSSQLYTIDQDFKVLKNFSQALVKIETEKRPEVDWSRLFQISDESELLKVAREKGHLGKQMLIVIHGAIAKEIVQQNPILDFKISPYLNDVIILVSGINEQLELTSEEKAQAFKEVYADVILTLLLTALNEQKTYKALSTYGEDILCNGVEAASEYLELLEDKDTQKQLLQAMCDATIAIETGLAADSAVSKAINTIKNSPHPVGAVNWNSLIMNLKSLYVKLDRDYTYLFQFSSYNMDDATKTKIDSLLSEAKEFWFGRKNMERSLRLSVKLGLRFLDILDHGLFNVTTESWLRMKYAIVTTAGPISVFDETVKLVTALLTNGTVASKLPPTTVAAASRIIPNIPQLTLDTVDIIVRDDTEVEPIIFLLNSTPWPCSATSISELLQLNPGSKEAVRGMETILCMNKEFVQEWVEYLEAMNNSVKIPPSWNSTEYQPHLFLTFSSMFDALVEDFLITKNTIELLYNDTAEERFGLKEAGEYAVNALSTPERDAILRKFFTKVDLVFNAMNDSSIPGDVPMTNLWERYSKCIKTVGDDCSPLGRKAWRTFFESLSIILENVANDLLTYMTELNDPNSNILQTFGFTRSTGLYMLYDKMPDFMGVLLNSYWDFGFMSQVRRASLSEFWDCDAIFTSMVIPPGSALDDAFMNKVQPFVCPSLLHWLSLPRGDNTLLDIFSKPQYYFFTIHVNNLTSRFEPAYTNAVKLADYIIAEEAKKKNKTIPTKEEIKENSNERKLEKFVDAILSFKLNITSPSYKLFNDINMKQFITHSYLTRLVSIINKLSTEINKIDVKTIYQGDDEKIKAIESDLGVIKYLFKRKPVDAINIHFDILTDVIWSNNPNYTLVDAITKMCSDLKANTSKTVLVTDERARNQICMKEYGVIYGAVQNVAVNDYERARNSLMTLVNILNSEGDVKDVFEFLNTRQPVINALRTSTKHSYELGIPVYLQYLQSNIRSYDVILGFLAGDDWWELLRDLYNGPYAEQFLGFLENSFDVAEDVITNIDEIHLVRLIHDIDVNKTELFCLPNITLSDYFPDRTGLWSELKRQLCDVDKTPLFQELPPLLFASQGYEDALTLPKEVDYYDIDSDISKIESRLDLIRDGPKPPQNPSWVTDEKVEHLRKVALQLLGKESLTKISFGLLGNVVDAGTLFLNSSQCTGCSQSTTWFKQLNLQLYKKQEYDNLLCHLQVMTLDDVYHLLKTEFHWDMAIKELISTRNYTKYEMNKSMNEFLGQVKVHLLEDLAATSTKLTGCLAWNVSRNEFGNATLFVSVLSHTTKLIRAQLPHLQEIEGVKELPYLQDLASEVAHKLDVVKPLKDYLVEKNDLRKQLKKIVGDNDVENIENAQINLRTIRGISSPSSHDIKISNSNWTVICAQHDCTAIASAIKNNLNSTLIGKVLPKYQMEEFWRFGFLSSILEHIGEFLSHGARLLGLASKVDVRGVMEGRLEPMLDAILLLITEDSLDNVMFSLQGMTSELRPLLAGTDLGTDLDALSSGLVVMRQLKNYMLEEVELKAHVWQLFPDAEDVELGLGALGINNTNFWSVAAPRIHAGDIQLKPLLASKPDDSHIAQYVCHMDAMSRVLAPADLVVVSQEDVFGAVIEQFCGMPDDVAKQVVPVLLRNLNFSGLFDEVGKILLSKVYSASNLTEEEGAVLMAKYPKMAALIPIVQDTVGALSDTLNNEPMFKKLRSIQSIGDLLETPEFLASAGTMMCGKPFMLKTNRFFKTLVDVPDLSTEPDQRQLDVLPTEFCRSIYRDIVTVGGGKIAWTFVKPLLMGKILYTPDTPTTFKIMQKANETFSTMVRMTELIHSFSSAFTSISKLTAHRDGVEALRRVARLPQLSALAAALLGDDMQIPDIDIDLDSFFGEFGDMDSFGGAVTQLSNLLRCINLNRLIPSPSEEQLIHDAAQLSIVDEFSAGVVFMNSDELEDGSFSNVEYKIRMDIDNAPTTSRLKDYLWIPGPDASFVEHMRYMRGFVQIQDIVDRAIIRLSHNASRPHTDVDQPMDWTIYTQQAPYPCYRKDLFQTSLYESQSLIVAFFFSLLFTVASTVRFIVSDKESGNTMLMSVMGVDLRWHTLSWFISSFLEMVVTSVTVTLILYMCSVLPNSNPSLIFVLIFTFGLSVLSFCYMLSRMFNSASLAAVFSAIMYLVSFMPFIIILSLEAVLYSTLKTFVCLSMSSSLCYAFLFVTRFEARGTGAQWADLWASPDESEDMNIGLAAIMMMVDAVIYFIIGKIIDRFFGIRTLKTNITECTTSDEKAGVSIVNVTKIYGEGSRRAKLALNNVSIELHKGHITTLLGHNGAGKTTLINILTGMLKPTKGHVIVRSDGTGTRLGVCPQRDVLLEYMSAREHVQLYAQLKSGKQAHEVQHEVDRMLEVLSLGPVCSEPVSRLSGGTRRRLCVALAFIGKPHLVSLDEPTAGVDPAARRDIWSMIVKLKEDRTILLTTHHLDEAELLSDQIVIMHKGQIHTTGSPIEIKRTLGNGYKLTVIYPPYDPEVGDTWEEPSQEEKTKQLLTVVRDVVKNANVVDVNGLEVEIAVPFFDANGLNNNFLQLCTVLEASQSSLGFKSYTLDCSSLEQVFFNICQQADAPQNGIEYLPEGSPSKSNSTSSVRTDPAAQELVPLEGPLKGTAWEQFRALMHARYLHHIRNKWLLFLLVVLPTLFITMAMGFSMLRPPTDNEVNLKLDGHLYNGSTEFLVPQPSIYSQNLDPTFAETVMQYLMVDKQTKNWTADDNPQCVCTEKYSHICEITANQTQSLPEMMVLPDVETMNQWLVETQQIYIEKRYGGFSSVLKENVTNLVAWYNNKGHHALPSYINSVNNAILRTVINNPQANISTYTHPLKISKEQISKATVYQHIADAGITGLLVLAYGMVSAGAAIYLVRSRCTQEKRLQLLCGVNPAMYWGSALVWDMMIILINLCITAILMLSFGFPVFIERNNLPAICILIVLYGYACSSFIHVAEKFFKDASMANMVLFCGNAFLGLSFIAVLLCFDIISESDATDNARWALHKLFMLAPQFALGDGLLDIAKNTIQAQVLSRFGMDTYRDPLNSTLLALHYSYLVVMGTVLLFLNLAIEHGYFDSLVVRFRPEIIPPVVGGEMEPVEVSAERKRVHASRALHAPLRVNTIGNINRGFVHTEGKKNSMQRVVSPTSDAAQCVELSKCYPGFSGQRVALRNLTLGIPPGQCTALLGQNGAGKSTTFSMLTGEVRPSSGQLYLNNELVDANQLCTGLISYCPQSDALDPLLTVTETLQFYCRLRGIAEQDEVIKRTISMFDLGRYSSARSGTLSGGNKRKLCTAIAFMARTPLVLLDEPTSGMDPVSRGCVARGVVAACARARGVLLSTHALDDARRLAARVALLRAGELVALAPLDECLNRFGGGYVVQCRVARGSPRAAWRQVSARAPHAQLRVLHQHALHFLMPNVTQVNQKEVVTRLSDIFRLMAELQGSCDIEDYTVNQSSLEQMFLSFTDKSDVESDAVEVEPLPPPETIRPPDSEELADVTSL